MTIASCLEAPIRFGQPALMHTRVVNAEIPVPQTQYAESDGLSIAYQVFGHGTTDLLFVPGIVSHIELSWEIPGFARMFRELGSHFRVILFDKRGQGLSDRFEGVPTLEERNGSLPHGPSRVEASPKS